MSCLSSRKTGRVIKLLTTGRVIKLLMTFQRPSLSTFPPTLSHFFRWLSVSLQQMPRFANACNVCRRHWLKQATTSIRDQTSDTYKTVWHIQKHAIKSKRCTCFDSLQATRVLLAAIFAHQVLFPSVLATCNVHMTQRTMVLACLWCYNKQPPQD